MQSETFIQAKKIVRQIDAVNFAISNLKDGDLFNYSEITPRVKTVVIQCKEKILEVLEMEKKDLEYEMEQL